MITNPVTVDEAIAKGRRMLFLPRALLIFGIFLFGFMIALLCLMLSNADRTSAGFIGKFVLIIAVSFFPFVYLPFLFWSKRTTKWKLWAFDHVDRVHDLNEAAKYAALFAVYGTFMDRIQIQSAAEREQWAALQRRFDNQYKYMDDDTVPERTVIYLSASHFIFNVIMHAICIAPGIAAVYIALKPDGPRALAVVGGIPAVIMLVNLFMLVRNFIRHQPRLILDNKGITTLSDGFHSWPEISNEALIRRYKGKAGMRWFLRFNHRNGAVEVNITALNTNWVRLEKLLRIYRGRSGNRRSF